MSDPKVARLRWRREPSASGLAGIGQGTRGWHLMLGDERVAVVAPLTNGPVRSRWQDVETGRWFWYASIGNESVNTAGKPTTGAAAAKSAAMTWVKAARARMGGAT